MFPRAVSTVLITAIIACPMWCGDAPCQAGRCCSAEHFSHQACCPVHSTDDCCGKEKPSDPDNGEPSDAPDKSPCQGVCGGAVFAKPCELNVRVSSSFASFVAIESPVAVQSVISRAVGGEPFLDRGSSHGRWLRTLHMSFLC